EGSAWVGGVDDALQGLGIVVASSNGVAIKHVVGRGADRAVARVGDAVPHAGAVGLAGGHAAVRARGWEAADGRDGVDAAGRADGGGRSRGRVVCAEVSASDGGIGSSGDPAGADLGLYGGEAEVSDGDVLRLADGPVGVGGGHAEGLVA